MGTAGWFAGRLGRGDLLVAPGAYDAMTARLVGASGAEAVYCGGFAATASAHGLPDIGLMGLADMAAIYQRVCRVVDIPVIADADTGYGGPLNVARTVALLSEAGVSAIHIEDQVDPKRCGHLAGKRVVPLADARERVAAAVGAAARSGTGIIARTDALAVEGMDSVLERGRLFAAAGADAFFVDAVRSTEQIRVIQERVDLPLVFNAATTGVSPSLSARELASLGIAVVIYPIELLLAALDGTRRMLADLLGGARVTPPATFTEINDLLGLDDYISRDRSSHAAGQASEPASPPGQGPASL
jgi:2-methylisocitrate lyase-like PEP mutase family enzyme